MRMHRAVSVLLAAGLASCAGGGFKPLSPEPMVWVDGVSHDFGTIPATEPVSHVFTVKNTGGKPLNITRVQTSCGCTAAVLDHQFLQPGEETRLKVQFDPRGRNGPQNRQLWIHSNDPQQPRRQLSVSATIGPAPETPAPAAPPEQPQAPAVEPASAPSTTASQP